MSTNTPSWSARDDDPAQQRELDDASQDQTSSLPMVDPEDPDASSESHHEAPPVDVDDREVEGHVHTPDVIALPDHGPETNNEDNANDAPDPRVSMPDDPTGLEDRLAENAGEEESWYDDPEPDPLDEDVTDIRDNAVNNTSAADDEPDTGPAERSGGAPEGDPGSTTATASAASSDGNASRSGRSWRSGLETPDVGDMLGRARGFFDPGQQHLSTEPHRLTLAVGALLVFLALLGNNGGLALVVLSAIVPILIMSSLLQRDVFESEPTPLILAVGVGGGVVGLIVGWLSSWIVDRNWIERGVLNYGAGGFAGRFAESAGNAPVSVWFLCGLILPAIAIAGVLGAPIALRRFAQFRNEVMDGVILAGTSGAGFAIGTALVYWAPMVSDTGPQTDVGDWTVAILGQMLVRPIILVLACAMIGAGVWKYMLTSRTSALFLPAIGGIGGFLLFTFGSILIASAGIWPEFLWTIVVAVAVFILYRIVLRDAVAIDRRALDNGDTAETRANRVVCPTCHQLTPSGQFCARCGASLSEPDAASRGA